MSPSEQPATLTSPGLGTYRQALQPTNRGTEMNTNLTQTDDQYMAVSNVMETISDAMEGKGTETLLVINLGSGGEDAVVGGRLTADAILRMESLLAELKARHENDTDGVLHVWRS